METQQGKKLKGNVIWKECCVNCVAVNINNKPPIPMGNTLGSSKSLVFYDSTTKKTN